MVRRPFRTNRSLQVSLGLLLAVALTVGVVAVGRGAWFDPGSATEDSTTSSIEASTTNSGDTPLTSSTDPPPTTRPPGPVARIIQWLNANGPLAGGAGGAEDAAFSVLLAGECQEVLTLLDDSTPGELADPERSLYEGAASACLAAFEGRRELWPRAEAAYARVGGDTSRLACETRTVYPLLQRMVEAHRADPNMRLVKRSGVRSTVLRCPRFTKITPSHGPPAGGYQVRIEGQNLPPVVAVNIDFGSGLRVVAARQDGQHVVITMPPAPPILDPEGWVSIWPDGAVINVPSAAVDFRYDPPAGTTSTASTASSTTTQPASTTSSTTSAPPSS